ncbi:MAG: hypothetical protein LBP50_10470 [Tannerella sp.]|jgi:hypothetical protein|nr:hypothetical protein [Tannerella sp.]
MKTVPAGWYMPSGRNCFRDSLSREKAVSVLFSSSREGIFSGVDARVALNRMAAGCAHTDA